MDQIVNLAMFTMDRTVTQFNYSDIHCHRLVGIWANVPKLGFGPFNFKAKSFGFAVQNFKVTAEGLPA